MSRTPWVGCVCAPPGSAARGSFASPPAWHFVCVSLSVTECFYNKIRPGLFIAASQVSVNMFSDRRHPLKYASCKQALLPSPLLENERIEK